MPVLFCHACIQQCVICDRNSINALNGYSVLFIYIND